MYRALYRKWRPQRFADVIGQEAIVTALQNQLAAGRIGHAYLFTGTRGTGKTTCAKIFAKAVNCRQPQGGDPCGRCPACRGIDDGSILDVVEIDAASNNSVDDIRDLREETAYLPANCKYKVYIIDEVHMLSASAFNALLKTMEEPPEHVIFILATTEVQKIPATILSRCQRYDFKRIGAGAIAARLQYVAGEEQIGLTPGAAALIGRLADGAMRDALSILDTCAGVSAEVDEALVRRMAGVTDRQYLFAISDAVAAGDAVAALEKIAQLRQDSVDMRRLCAELAGHYRNLMLCALPGGEKLLTGTSPEEDAAYLARREAPQSVSIRAVGVFGKALERMAAGADARLEIELALFALTQPETPAAAAGAAPQPFVSAPLPAVPAQAAPQSAPAAPENTAPSAVGAAPEAAAPVPAQPPRPAAPSTADAAARPSPAPAPEPAPEPLPFLQWPAVLNIMEERDPMLISFLRGTRAFFDGRRVLIDCGEAFRDFMRKNKNTAKNLKEYIFEATGVHCGIGPYAAPKPPAAAPVLEDTLAALRGAGVDVVDDR